MNWNSLLPLLIVVSALLPGLIIFAVDEERKNLRTLLNLGGAGITFTLIVILLSGVYRGELFETRFSLLPNIDLVLHADALSLLFVSLSGLLWLVTTVYAIGYLEGSPHRSRFFGFFSLCVSATMGIALAGNLVSFLIFYELLTLATFPLVVHRGTRKSLRAGRIYLGYTLFGGALLLAGVAWLKALAGPLDFTATGILSGMPGLDRNHLMVIFGLLIAGLGVKAALFPLHGWLPVAMAAPAPVSALLHAVAVVKAGAFGIVRVVYDVYGIEFSRELGLTTALAAVATFTIIYGSVRALAQNDLKKRLAYSTVSQVSYIALGAAIAGPLATLGGIVHLVHQGLMKITLFFCAGNLAETLGIHKVSEMNGVGRRMPWTMAAFTVAALGMIGVPPVAGFVSKWYLGVGAAEAGAYWVMGVLAISSLLNAGYFLPILYAAWFKPLQQQLAQSTQGGGGRGLEAHWMLLVPPLFTAALAMAAGIFAAGSVSPLTWAKLIAAREYGREAAQAVLASTLSAPLYWWAIALPILLVLIGLAAPKLRALCVRLTPYTAMPALLAALLPLQENNELAWLFFGSVIGLDNLGRVFLLLAALLWFAAALYGQHYLRKDAGKSRFFLYFLLAMGGNFGLILSQDVYSFITFFTLMSLAAYGLVVHNGNTEARCAGNSYMRWVILGEVLLFAGFTWLAHSSGAISFRELASLPQNPWVLAFVIAGFGIKAGLIGLHFWLPLAHPAAPVPASAVLSGVMVKAGLLGWLRVLPLGATGGLYESAGLLLVGLGLVGAFLGVLLGLLQRNPKTLLAYSTVSQMGILAAGLGAGFMAPQLLPLLIPALLLYAFHHGLAKGALFFGVGLVPQLPGKRRLLFWVGLLIPALALVGLPFTSGAFAKAALKDAVAELSWLAYLLPLTAVGTTLLMARFTELLKAMPTSATQSPAVGRLMLIPYAIVLLAGCVGIYGLPQAQLFAPLLDSLDGYWSATWPLLIGLLLYGLCRNWLPVAVAEPREVSEGQPGFQFMSPFSKQPSAAGSTGVIKRWLATTVYNNPVIAAKLSRATTVWNNPGIIFVAVLLGIFVVLII